MKTIKRNDVTRWIPTRDEETYKNELGHVLCIGGSANMGGAIILSASAALHAGAGLVTVASAPENHTALLARIPEAMFIDFSEMKSLVGMIRKVDVIVLGPGLGLTDIAEQIFKTVLDTVTESQWLILDGDALTLLSESNQTLPTQQTVLTPHLGEWERLTDIKAPADDLNINKKQQARLNTYVILKKPQTEVYFGEEVWQNTAGNPSMATGGMGDALTGILASFLGQFDDKEQAILSAVYIHSVVADYLARTHYVTLPSKIIEELPTFIKKLKNEETS